MSGKIMRLQTILLILSWFAAVSVAGGGVYYYSSLRGHEYETARRRAASHTEVVKNQISAFLYENLKTVKALAGLEELRAALDRPTASTLAEANRILDHFQQALGVGVCYLLDAQGDTKASSNRHAPDSFVGNNFSWRPYFKRAIRGVAGKYLALGTTSKKRGAYYSYPVFAKDGRRILGVTVIKASIGALEKTIVEGSEGITLLTGPFDVIFSSSRQDWLNKTLLEGSPEAQDELAVSRQFGAGPWEWVGLRVIGGNLAEDRKGRRFGIYSLGLEKYPDWKVVHLQSLGGVGDSLLRPLARTTGVLVLALCLAAGLAVYFLYQRAQREISKREVAETSLRQAQEMLSNYSKDLPCQVRQRNREIIGFLKYAPAVVFVKDPEGRYVMVNHRWEELFGLSKQEVKGKTVYDVFPLEAAAQFCRNDLKVLKEKTPLQVEEVIPVGGKTKIYLSVRFPVLNGTGQVTWLCGISVDISDLKKAQDQLQRLSGGIIASQEKERTAIARELHDELGQVLTALRIEAVWLRERLRGQDPKAHQRAANMCTLIEMTINDVRHIATRLRPPVLDDLGLVDALEWYAAQFEKRTNIVCVFKHYKVPPVREFTCIAAYRVAQEALTNVARHSGANNVEVIVEGNNGILRVAVVDDGQGFDPESLAGMTGLGLAGMRERASLAGGRVEIRTQPGRGAGVYLRLPLEFRLRGEA